MNLEPFYKIKNEEKNEYIKYKYARGYIISTSKFIVKESWKILEFGKRFFISYDPQNEVVYSEDKEGFFCLIYS